jgi:serine/threonine protein kinase
MHAGARFDHYELISLTGQGGMGEVWKARDTKLGRIVAIKFVRPTWATDERVLERLRIEARAASTLNHPNICTIHDFREHDGCPSIVMEFMNGRTLHDQLQIKPLKIPEVVDIGIQVADALASAHSHGIIHRDIKPANIFLTEDRRIKVLDFGLAKVLQQNLSLESTNLAAVHTLTTLGDVLGTVSYMSPEQATGEELDGRTDLFSLGVVLYQCATGCAPFPGKTIAVVLSSIMNRAPVPPIALNPEVPLRLQEVIHNCLEKDRELRCQSAINLGVELKRVRRDLEFAHLTTSTVAMQQESGSEQTSGRATASIPTSRIVPNAGKVRSWTVQIGIGVTVMVMLFAAAYLTLRQPSAPPQEANGPSVVAAEDLSDRASRSLRDGNYRAAAAAAKEILQQAPDNTAAAKILAEAQTQLGRFDQAIAEARRWLIAGNTQRAEQALQIARRIDPSAPELADLSSQLVGQLSAETRAALARDAAKLPPASVSPSVAAVPPAATPTQPVRLPDNTGPPLEEPRAPQAVTQPPQTVALSNAAPVPTPTPEPTSPPRPNPSEAIVRPAEPAPRSQPAPAAPEPRPANVPVAAAVPSNAVLSNNDEVDQAAIRTVIGLYRQAIETQNLDLVRQIKPNLSAAEARSFSAGFQAVSSQKVDLTILSIDLRKDTAVVKLERRDTLQARGTQQRSPARQQTIHLIRTGSRWVIDNIGQ